MATRLRMWALPVAVTPGPAELAAISGPRARGRQLGQRQLGSAANEETRCEVGG
jgi:hypothetical protein